MVAFVGLTGNLSDDVLHKNCNEKRITFDADLSLEFIETKYSVLASKLVKELELNTLFFFFEKHTL